MNEQQENEIMNTVSDTQIIETNSKMKQCPTCSNVIAKSAKRCPFCGAKNKKKFYKRKRFWVIVILLIVIIINLIPKNDIVASEQSKITTSVAETTEPTLYYQDIYEGDVITTGFVSITIDEISTTNTIYSINSNAVLNSDPGDIYVYIKGTITNTSPTSYDIGGMGSWSYNTSTYIDADLELSNGESEYGSLLIDDGGTYGILSDGYLSPYDSVTYYIAFNINETYYYSYNKGEITLAFTENFFEKPSYNRDNCDYLYRINFWCFTLININFYL